VPALQAASKVVVLDWSFTMLAAAQKRTGLRCAGDLRRMPFRDGTFGGVHAAHAIQNVTEWREAIGECVPVALPSAPVVVAWGGPPADERLAGLQAAFFDALGTSAGARAQRSGISLDAANECFAALGKPISVTFAVEGTQVRTPRQIAERAALNPYRSQARPTERAHAVQAALWWAERHIGPVDVPVTFPVAKLDHTYRPAEGCAAIARTRNAVVA